MLRILPAAGTIRSLYKSIISVSPRPYFFAERRSRSWRHTSYLIYLSDMGTYLLFRRHATSIFRLGLFQRNIRYVNMQNLDLESIPLYDTQNTHAEIQDSNH